MFWCHKPKIDVLVPKVTVSRLILPNFPKNHDLAQFSGKFSCQNIVFLPKIKNGGEVLGCDWLKEVTVQ